MDQLDVEELMRVEGRTKVLANKVFEKKLFNELKFFPKKDEYIRLSNIKFDHCKVDPYRFVVFRRTSLIDVQFNELNCGDLIQIDAEALLSNVVFFADKHKPKLRIRPSKLPDINPQDLDHENYSLDISGYTGDVDIIGVPAEKVKINRDLHVRLFASDFADIDWNAPDFSACSTIKWVVTRLLRMKMDSTIFALIPKGNSGHAEIVREVSILKEYGFIR